MLYILKIVVMSKLVRQFSLITSPKGHVMFFFLNILSYLETIASLPPIGVGGRPRRLSFIHAACGSQAHPMLLCGVIITTLGRLLHHGHIESAMAILRGLYR